MICAIYAEKNSTLNNFSVSEYTGIYIIGEMKTLTQLPGLIRTKVAFQRLDLA